MPQAHEPDERYTAEKILDSNLQKCAAKWGHQTVVSDNAAIVLKAVCLLNRRSVSCLTNTINFLPVPEISLLI